MNKKLTRAALSLGAMIFAAAPALAQQQAAANDGSFSERGLAYIAAGIGLAIAAGLAALGQGRVASAACEGAARNPGAAGRIQILMILGLAFIETMMIFTFVIAATIVFTKLV
jgi:F-type H+-transporting ATPase subunit c